MLETLWLTLAMAVVVPGLLHALLVTSDCRVSECYTASRKAGKEMGSGADKITASEVSED